MSLPRIIYLISAILLIVGYFLSWESGASLSGFDKTVSYFKTGDIKGIILGFFLSLGVVTSALGLFKVFSDKRSISIRSNGFTSTFSIIIYFVLTLIFTGALELFPSNAGTGYYLFLLGFAGQLVATLMFRKK